MEPSQYAKLKQVLSNYFTDIQYSEITQLNSKSNANTNNNSNSNETFKVKVRKNLFILKKLNSNKDKVDDLVQDLIHVTDYLALNNFETTNLVETTVGEKFVKIENETYILYKYIYGIIPKKFDLSNNHLKSLGIYLANVHKSLKELQYTPKKSNDTKNTKNIQTSIKNQIKTLKEEINKFEEDDKELINAMIEEYDKVNKEFLENVDNNQIIHGNSIIENVLYDKQYNDYYLINFNDILIENKFNDIGSLCSSFFISENTNKVLYSRKMHDKFIIGYYLTMVKNTQKVERISKEDFMKQCVDATMLVSLQNTLKYYIDSLKNDNKNNIEKAQNSYELFRVIHKDNYTL